jgi:hypothetical protein
VAAAGNEGTVASSPLTRHASVVTVMACDDAGRPMAGSNLARSIGARGVGAPGRVTTISPEGPPMTSTGTSFAAALVSGACGLLRSARRSAPGCDVIRAMAGPRRRTSITPPLLDAWAAHERLGGMRSAA